MTLEFTVDPELTDELRAQVVACWTDVTNAGGAVGFIPPVTMDDVLPTAERALAGVAAGRDRLVIGRAAEIDDIDVVGSGAVDVEGVAAGSGLADDHASRIPSTSGATSGSRITNAAGATGTSNASRIASESGMTSTPGMAGTSRITPAGGRLAALAFIADEQSFVAEHLRIVKRVMVHPDFQGRGYGMQLMAEVERTARAMGLRLLTLDCRDGTGSDKFYRKCGYVEYGRLPGALRVGVDEYSDRILMTLSLRG